MPKPDFCPFIYHDGRSLFVEFDKMVMEFPFTEGGLHKALKIIPNIAAQPGYVSGRRNVLPRRPGPPRGYVARRPSQLTAPATKTAKSTDAQRIQDRLSGKVKATVADLIRKAKL
jgi:hypothetical protein